MNCRRIGILTCLAAALMGPALLQAETFWTVVEGKAALSLSTERLESLGLRIDLSSGDSSKAPDGVPPARIILTANAASSLGLLEERGVFEQFTGGAVEFDQGIVFSYDDTALAVEALRLRPAEPDSGFAYVLAGSFSEEKEILLLGLKSSKMAFGRISKSMAIEVGEMIIMQDLGTSLGDAKLAGTNIGAFNALAALTWSGGEDPEILQEGIPRGGSPRATCTYPAYGPGPDVIVGDLVGVSNYSSESGIEALAVGTTSCNLGDAELNWISSNNQHPVIGQNFFRHTDMPDGSSRFEQIGQSWLKHGFTALQGTVCCDNCQSSGTGSRLGVGCSDPYSSSLNGSQGNLGPKWEVNAHTGNFTYPYTDSSGSGTVYKRLQVAISDIDPALNPGASYFVGGHYVAADDAGAGNGNNNASYRPITVSGGGSAWSFSLAGSTQREQAGIRAWQDTDASVTETDVQIPNEGLVVVAVDVTDLGGGNYHYEYAVHNINSDRSIGSFSVPVGAGATVSNIGFHDVDYHSGEPFDGTDWPGSEVGGVVTWSTDSFATEPNANALRWGTLYNFRFDADVAPGSSQVTLGLFKPGSPTSVSAVMPGPNAGPIDCQPNGVDDTTDIADGTSMDCNGNGIPDECEAFSTTPLEAIRMATGLSSPVYVCAPPGDVDRLFIVEQGGRIKILDLTTELVLGTPYLDISAIISSGGERGLLSVAFHPNYASNSFFYVNYTNTSGNTVIARYTVSVDPNVADSGSAVIMKTVTQDFSNHNGGQLQFGPDDMLYVGMGDGGDGGDPNDRAQDDSSLLGKMLRLDVDNSPTYIPIDNPGGGWLPEVWAKGLRNPWRFSFDRLTGDLYIGDVGQNAWEEIDFQSASSTGGENYGWRCREGAHDYNTTGCAGPYDEPIYEYSHSIGTPTGFSLTGGYVYRGCTMPDLSGTYFFADYVSDWLYSFKYDSGSGLTDLTDRTLELTPTTGAITSISSFGEDASGELYVVSLGGSIYKIVPAGTGGPICGDGTLDPGEECDDGNDVPGDGCFDCQVEPPCLSPVLFEDDFESGNAQGWNLYGPDSTASTGNGEIGDPNGTSTGGQQAQPEDAYGGAGCLFTAQNSSLGTDDVDGGVVYIESPTINLNGQTDVVLTYMRWFYQRDFGDDPAGDFYVAQVSDDNGGSWVTVESMGDSQSANDWARVNVVLQDYISLTSTVQFRFGASDGATTGDIIELAIDSVVVGPPCSTGCGDGTLDPGEECDDGNADPNDGCDNCVITGDEFRGGKLYDKWWIVNGGAEPVADHPLWSRQATNMRTGSATWRCKECHGWDYKGAGGAYGSGSHFTGFGGVLASALTPTEMFNLLKNPESPADPDGHDYGAAGMSDADIADVVVFLQTLLIDMDTYITFANKAFIGDEVAGQNNYNITGTCIACHGADGTAIDFDSGPGVEWVGTIAWNNPWELMHKVRVGQPGVAGMPSYLNGLGNDQDVADIGKYAQLTFPVECTSAIHCDDGIACTADSCDGRFCLNTPSPADGDFDGIGGATGDDIQAFVDAIINGATVEDECHGDFDGMNSVDVGDIPGMVNALLTN